MEREANLPSLTDFAQSFVEWCDASLTRTPGGGAIINAVQTRLRHVKVEQIIAGCHMWSPLDLNLPISIEFRRFIRNKPVIRTGGLGAPCIRLTQGASTYDVFDSGFPLDREPGYACPVYPFRHTKRNQSGKDWLFTIDTTPWDHLSVTYRARSSTLSGAVQIGAMMRLYANMAMALGQEAGFEFLVNLCMDNVSLKPDKLLTSTISVEGPRMNFTYGFWGQPTVSTGKSIYHRRFRREFAGELGLASS